MKKGRNLIVFLFAWAVVSLSVQAQTGQHDVKGLVRDSSGASVPGATVVLLQSADSVMESFTSTDADGNFQLKRVSGGRYILQVSYIGHSTYSKALEVNGPVDLGPVVLRPKNTQLKEVDISSEHIPVVIKNDTVEYNAKAFKTQPNAAVEDLLKRLPGVEVEKDGTIKAHGKTVNKVLVDGKEFFGDDPKVATKNLPADAIDKVQVFDKKSDMAEFTGIDDGERDKTINLKLKDEKRKGVFGKVTGGYGTDERYEARANINSFRKKTQVSLIGLSNNTNQQGFSVMDYVNFMGGFRNMAGGGQGGSLSLNPGDIGVPLNMGSSNGFTTTTATGVNFNYDLGEKTEIRSSYFYNQLDKTIDKSTFRQSLQGRGSFNTSESSGQRGSNTGQRLNLVLRHRIDSTQRLTMRNNLSFTSDHNLSLLESRSVSTDGTSRTSNSSVSDLSNSGYRLNSRLTYIKKFGRKGRNTAVNLNYDTRDGSGLTTVRSVRTFVPPGSLDTLDQEQDQRSYKMGYGYKLSYTEPLGRNKFLEFNYAFQENSGVFRKDFTDILYSPERTEVPNPLLSNKFDNTFRYYRGGSGFKINGKKYNLTAGAAYQRSRLQGAALTEVDRSFDNILPMMNFDYRFTQSKQLQMLYQTSISEPSVEQLQPVVNNSDPLNLYVGNPELKPEYLHNTNLSFNSFDQFSFTNIFAALNTTYTRDKITNFRSVDSNFVQTSKPINVERDIMVNSYLSFSTPLRFIKSKINTSGNILYNRGILYVNDVRNNMDRWVNTVDISLENRKKEIVDASAGLRYTFNITRYSETSARNQNFVNRTYYTDISLILKGNWTLAGGLDYTVFAKEEFGAKKEVPILKASLSKQFLKNNRGELKLSAVDILNRNVGISRISNFNYVQEENVRSLGRYFMLSFTYSLSKFPTGDNVQIRERGRG